MRSWTVACGPLMQAGRAWSKCRACSSRQETRTKSGVRGRGARGMVVIRCGCPNRHQWRSRRAFAGQRWKDPGGTDAGRDEGLILGGKERTVAHADLVRRSGFPMGGMVAAMRVRRGVFMRRNCCRRTGKRHSRKRHECMQSDCKGAEPCREIIRSSFHVAVAMKFSAITFSTRALAYTFGAGCIPAAMRSR